MIRKAFLTVWALVYGGAPIVFIIMALRPWHARICAPTNVSTMPCPDGRFGILSFLMFFVLSLASALAAIHLRRKSD
ncbi:hypothetical protein [Sphingomonas sp. RT2P30]|uniref:hypothetical protein n=1 Tax=Parasphingomonas halimpatiens TaxID=3096162 RepID=UPI002FCC36E5